MTNADQRHATVRDLMADLTNYRSFDAVGMPHPEVRELNLTDRSLKPPAPPPDELSVASAAAAEALRELKSPLPKADGRKPTTKTKVIRPETVNTDLNPKTRRIAALAGGGLLVVCLLGAWVAGSAPFALRGFVALLAALPTLLIPVEPKRVRTGRVVFGFGAVMLLALIDPTGLLASRPGPRGTLSGDPGSNAATVRRLANVGHTQFADVSLNHADLSGANLANAVLDRADLTGANLSGARLVGASLVDARLQGATLSGADLRDARVQAAIDLNTANCDGTTLFPPGGACVKGHPAFH
jgi:hypothetical protein